VTRDCVIDDLDVPVGSGLLAWARKREELTWPGMWWQRSGGFIGLPPKNWSRF